MKKGKIKNLSRVLKIMFFVITCSLPILEAGYWITNGYPFIPSGMRYESLSWSMPMSSLGIGHTDAAKPSELAVTAVDCMIKPLTELSNTTKFLGFLVSLLPLSITMFILFLVSRLFYCFEHMEFFSATTVKSLKRIGFLIILNQTLIHAIYDALISLTLTFSNPPGYRIIEVSYGSAQINILIVGIIIILASWIMDEGRKMQEEQEGTI
jgi:hypothetical protein